jgi:hypothetical protein
MISLFRQRSNNEFSPIYFSDQLSNLKKIVKTKNIRNLKITNRKNQLIKVKLLYKYK